MSGELEAIRGRYERRDAGRDAARYDPTSGAEWWFRREREAAVLGLLRRAGLTPLSGRSFVEIGCGSGGNLLDLLRWGAEPENLAGVDLLPERVERARRRLPSGVELAAGDAREEGLFGGRRFDAALAFTVFSSILDRGFQEDLAARTWARVRPGGGVLWYDLARDNPRNRDVKGVSRSRIRELFPGADPVRSRLRRVTLAPPLARALARLSPGGALYGLANGICPLARSHLAGWIAVPVSEGGRSG